MFSETALSECNDNWGLGFWTAGQRIDPTTESTFVWKVSSSGTNSDHTVTSAMNYTHWHPGEPNFSDNHESCMQMTANTFYHWIDAECINEYCSVCELDM